MPRDYLINSATGNTIIKSHLDIIGKMVINDLSGSPATASDGTLVINHGRGGSASSIVFTSASNPNSDYAYIQYQDTRETGAENSLLTIGVENDGAIHPVNLRDDIKIAPSGSLFITGNTIIENTNQSVNINTGSFVAKGGVGIAGNAYIGGNVSVGGKMVISEPGSTPASVSDGTLLIKHATSGGSSSIVFKSAFDTITDYAYIQYDDSQTAGGEKSLLTIGARNDGIGTNQDDIKIDPTGELTITSVTKITNSTNSTSTTTGALVVGGGAGVSGALCVGTTATINGTTTITNTTQSTSKDTGALIVDGGVGIEGSINIGGSANIGGKMVISEPGSTTGADGGTLLIRHATSGGSSSIRFDSTVNRDGGDYAYIQYDDNRGSGENSLLTIGTSNDGDDDIKITPTGSLEITSVTKITNNTQSTSTTTGSLVVTGGIGISGALCVGTTATINGTTTITNTTQSTSKDTGALIVDGGVGIEGSINIGGSANIGGKMVISETGSTPASVSDGTLLIKHATSGGSSSIVFKSAFDTTTDYAYIQYDDSQTAGGEKSLLTIGARNDGIGTMQDDIKIDPTGELTITSVTKITNSTASTSTSTGALVVSGGAGVSGALNVGGVTNITNSTASTSTTTGALVVGGGVGVAGSLYVGGSIISGSITPAGSIMAYLGTTDPTGWVIADGFIRGYNSTYSNVVSMSIGSRTSAIPNPSTIQTYAVKIFLKNPYNQAGDTTDNVLGVGKIVFVDQNGADITNLQINSVKSIQGDTGATSPTGTFYTFTGYDGTNATYTNNTLTSLFNNTYSTYGVMYTVSASTGISIIILFTQLYTFSSIKYYTTSNNGGPHHASNITLYYSNSTTQSVGQSAYLNNTSWTQWYSYNNTTILYRNYSFGLFFTNDMYAPPDYRGAFLRGTGTSSVNSGYAGPNIKTSQNHATQTHSHGVNDPGHKHHLRATSGGEITGQPLAYNWVHNSGFGTTEAYYEGSSSNLTGITVNDSSGVGIRYIDTNETRPFNFGVNWIIKL